MSRLDSLSGASFRPAQTQTAPAAAEKVASKILDGGGNAKGRFDKDSFECRPRLPKLDPQPPKQDPGFYACNAHVPNPGDLPGFPKDLPKWEPKPLPFPKHPLPKWEPQSPVPLPKPIPKDILDRLLKDLGL